MRLIDADAFELNVQNEWERNEISNGDWILIRQLINEEPTIDAVSVVRCRKCKWFDKDNFEDTYCTWSKGLCDASPNAFCSYGEAEEEEDVEEPDFSGDECGFNPYMGCYDYDC